MIGDLGLRNLVIWPCWGVSPYHRQGANPCSTLSKSIFELGASAPAIFINEIADALMLERLN